MKKNNYFIYIFLTCALLIFLICSINYVVDPEKIFGSKKISSKTKTYVEKLLSTKNYIHEDINITERELKIYLAKNKIIYDCAIIGSSSIQQIDSKIFTNELKYTCPSLLNLGVSSGTIEDIFIFSEILLNNEIPPKTLIININPWTFNFGRAPSWQYSKDLFLKINSKLGSKEDYSFQLEKNDLFLFKLIENLFNAEYLKASMDIIYENFFNTHRLDSFQDTDKFAYYNHEGAMRYSKYFLRKKSDSHKNLFFSKDETMIVKDEWMSNLVLNKFDKLIKLLKKKFNIILIMVPYSPDVYKIKDQPLLTAMKIVEDKVHKISNQNNLKIIGSFNPELSSCNRSEFLNSSHPKISCLKKLQFQNK